MSFPAELTGWLCGHTGLMDPAVPRGDLLPLPTCCPGTPGTLADLLPSRACDPAWLRAVPPASGLSCCLATCSQTPPFVALPSPV